MWGFENFNIFFRTLQDHLNNIKNPGSFIRNVSIVFSGNAANTLLQFIFSPILSRIFPPEAYGEYAFFNLIITNISFFFALSLPSVFLIQKTRYDFLALSKFVITAVFVASVLSLLGLYFVRGFDLNIKDPIVVITLFLIINLKSFNSVLSTWNIRGKKFARNTWVDVASTVISKLSGILMGVSLYSSGIILVMADFIKALVLFFGQSSIRMKMILFRFLFHSNRNYVSKSVKENINVPKYIFPSHLFSKWIGEIPILLIGAMYGKENLGFYVFAMTILAIPKGLIENSIAPVMFQRANEEHQRSDGDLGGFFLKSMRFSAPLSFLPVVLIGSLAPLIFPFVFGENWMYSGQLATMLSIKFMMQSLITPYTGLWRVLRREKELLKINIVSSILSLLPLLLIFTDIEYIIMIQLLGIFGAIGTLLIILELLNYFYGAKKGLSMALIISLVLTLLYVIVIISSKLVESFYYG